jgi:ABC-type transport system involved in multi-copper enzyme maturation permease subunit
MRAVLAIAHHTALEALRGRTLLWSAATLLFLVGASLFLREIAIADGARLQTAFLAASMRLAGAFIAATVIIGAMVREFNEQGHLLLLSLPLTRSRYCAGKFLGFTWVLFLLALMAALLLALFVPPVRAAAWGVALFLELLIVGSMGLFAAVSLRQMLPALLLTLGFYGLARAIGGIQLLAHWNPTQGAWLTPLVDGLAWLLPRLDGFAASARVLGEGGSLTPALVQSALYCALLINLTLLDVNRRDL